MHFPEFKLILHGAFLSCEGQNQVYVDTVEATGRSKEDIQVERLLSVTNS